MDDWAKKLGCFGVIVFVGLLFCFWMFAMPLINVWRAEQEGLAELKQAEGNRQIAIQEALAKRESAKALADAEVERARGVAEANRIIGDSLKGNDEYLHYLWIHNMEVTQNQVIYVPTEAGLPILESGKRIGK